MKHWIIEITKWYAINSRDLPWRKTKDPYCIWVSEIIFQQTRIEQGMNYYINFITKFPSVFDLAKAPLDEVLKVWQGLGYYRRALHLHETAKYIVDKFRGKFPSSYNEILQLKGIGSYTAAAIASICFNEKVPVIDGNVHRLFCRFFEQPYNRTSKTFLQIVEKEAQIAMSKHVAGQVNQAMMEYGALVCKTKPLCKDCVIRSECKSFNNNTVNEYPPKQIKKDKPILYYQYYYIHDGTHCYLNKRQADDLWKGLYEFPLVERKRKPGNQADTIFILKKLKILETQKTSFVKQVLTHKIIYAQLIIVKVEMLFRDSNFLLVEINNLSNYPFSKLMKTLITKELARLNKNYEV